MTLWTFLTQVLSLDHCCLKAVACLIAYRTARGLELMGPRHYGFDLDFIPIEQQAR